jgi:hypothetical protein
VGPTKKLQIQASRKLDLRQSCHELTEKSSKIVPLGAPLFAGSVTVLQGWGKQTKQPTGLRFKCLADPQAGQVLAVSWVAGRYVILFSGRASKGSEGLEQ